MKTNTNNTRDKIYRETSNINEHRGFGGIPMKSQGSTFTDANSNVSARRNPLHSSATSHSHQNVLHESTMHMSSKVSNLSDRSESKNTSPSSSSSVTSKLHSTQFNKTQNNIDNITNKAKE